MSTKAKAIRALKFMRLVDRDGQISLTNVVLIAVTVHLLRQPGLEIQDLLAFVAGVVGYQVRQTVLGRQVDPNEDLEILKSQMSDLEKKLSFVKITKTGVK